MDVKEFLLDLYELEVHKRLIFSDDIDCKKPKQGKELEFKLAQKHIKIISKLLDELE